MARHGRAVLAAAGFLAGCLIGLRLEPAVAQGRDAPSVVVWSVDAAARLSQLQLPQGDEIVVATLGALLTDIASAPDGQLFGIDFENLYRIDPATGATLMIGPHGIDCANAFEITPAGEAFVMGCATPFLYRLALDSAKSTSVGRVGFRASGDLAAIGDALYLTAIIADADALIEIHPPTGSARLAADLGVDRVFGLAAGPDGALYAGAGRAAFSVETATGAVAPAADFSPTGSAEFYGWAPFIPTTVSQIDKAGPLAPAAAARER